MQFEEMFHFELPSITLQRLSEKFEIEHCNVETVLIKLNFVVFLVTIVPVFIFVYISMPYVYWFVDDSTCMMMIYTYIGTGDGYDHR